MLKVFVYGTLKRGQRNHDHYCAGAIDISTATTVGRLLDLPFDFPGLRVPESAIQAIGSSDYLADVRKQESSVEDPPNPEPSWDLIHGELITFDDPDNLSSLDTLEGYTPGEKGLYVRVLVPVTARGGPQLAWCYALTREFGTRLPDGRWPA